VEHQSIVILDFGSQVTQLIARRIREQKVFSVVLPCTSSLDEIRSYNPVGIILSGGPCSVYEKGAPTMDDRVFSLGQPVLGICYGLQVIAHKLGGRVNAGKKREFGHADVNIIEKSPLFEDLPQQMPVWMSHGDEATQLPTGFHLVAKSTNAIAAIENTERKIYAVQFHPEVHHTRHGTDILKNFVFKICGARGDWTPQRFIDETVEQIKKQVGDGHAICALSGGVDSSVAATLVHRAIGDRLTCVFVNNGVLRLKEFEKVQQNLRERLGLNVVAVDASQRFLKKLKRVTEPERKRKIIGNEFIAVFDDAVKHLLKGDIPHNATVDANYVATGVPARRRETRNVKRETRNEKRETIDFLVQGTLYPDVIESRSVRGPSQTIKTHHNVGGLPKKMKLKLIEPLKDLFKDEVRRIGRDLGVPEELLTRQPFPGPGLAVRILGEVTPERIAILQQADDIVVSEIKTAGLYTKIWQSFAVLLPVMSVGVMGDARTYAYTCAIRAVHSEDGMTADVVELPWEVLKRISTRIVNEVKGINRVVYDTTSKPPGTIEWE
jgi:GMP synthase (glutamine-hydrolysing)